MTRTLLLGLRPRPRLRITHNDDESISRNTADRHRCSSNPNPSSIDADVVVMRRPWLDPEAGSTEACATFHMEEEEENAAGLKCLGPETPKWHLDPGGGPTSSTVRPSWASYPKPLPNLSFDFQLQLPETLLHRPTGDRRWPKPRDLDMSSLRLWASCSDQALSSKA